MEHSLTRLDKEEHSMSHERRPSQVKPLIKSTRAEMPVDSHEKEVREMFDFSSEMIERDRPGYSIEIFCQVIRRLGGRG